MTTGIGQVHFELLRGVAVGDEVLIDNTRVPRLPDLSPSSGAARRLPGVGPVPRRRPADLPAATRAARPALRAQRRRRAPERPLRRQDDRGPVPARRGRLSAAGGLVPAAGRSGARPAHRRPVPAVVRRPCDARRPGGAGRTRRRVRRRTTRIVNYRGVLEQALRDVAAWANAAPRRPPSTNYELVDGQIVVPPSAAERSGHPAGRDADRERRRARRGRGR